MAGMMDILEAIHDDVRQENRTRRDEWIAAARRSFTPVAREACYICGKFEAITEAHHVAPLHLQFKAGFETPNDDHFWLCPNHHAMLHVFLDQQETAASINGAALVMADTTRAEREKLCELFDMARTILGIRA